ncbi:MAG: hypothetical protein U0401_25085 [Anaerolineae bacterium]
MRQGDFYVGLRPQGYVGQAGQENPIDVVVDWDSQPVPNQEVELMTAEYNFTSVQQLNPESRSTRPMMITPGKISWIPRPFLPPPLPPLLTAKLWPISLRPKPEITKSTLVPLIVMGRGALGHLPVGEWADYVNWGQEDNNRVTLVTDQRQYSMGDTASVLVPHPFSGTVTALVTLERVIFSSISWSAQNQQ